MDKKTEHVLLGIAGTLEETQKLIEDCRIDIERKRGVVAGLQAAATSLHALAEKKASEAKKAEGEGKISGGDIILVKREIAGINGSHAVLLELLSANQREQRIAEGKMTGYNEILLKTQARVIALKEQSDRRKREAKNEGKGRPEPVRKALKRDKAPKKKKKAARKAAKKKGAKKKGN